MLIQQCFNVHKKIRITSVVFGTLYDKTKSKIKEMFSKSSQNRLKLYTMQIEYTLLMLNRILGDRRRVYAGGRLPRVHAYIKLEN